MNAKIRILLVEDHTLVRAGIHSLLENLPDFQVVAEAGDGREALRLVEQVKPDLVFMDVSMPGLNGLEATARIVKEFPGVRVVILSMHTAEEYVLQALRAGASGYVLKDASPAELDFAVRAIVGGSTYLSPAISKHLVEYVQRVGSEISSLERLTSRQREVLQLVAEGRTTKEIAHILNVGPKTVETHRAELMERLGIHDVAGLVRYAIRMGIISPDS